MRLDGPAKHGAGAVLRRESQSPVIRPVPCGRLVEEGRQPPLTGRCRGARRRCRRCAFADVDFLAPDDRDALSVQPVEGRIAAAATCPMIKEAAGAEVHPRLKALEVFAVDSHHLPLPTQGVDSLEKGAVVDRASRRRTWRGCRVLRRRRWLAGLQGQDRAQPEYGHHAAPTPSQTLGSSLTCWNWRPECL
jgi:hypothetical protein